MTATRFALAATAVAAVLVLALIASFGLRDNNQVAAPQTASPSASATASASPEPSASSSPARTTSLPNVSQPSVSPGAQQTGTITGKLGYPSDFVPALTIYAISVSDPSVWYSTTTPRFGNTSGAPSPSPSPAATWPSSGPGTYSLSLPAGTYYVLGYFTEKLAPPSADKPGPYSRYTVDCIQKTRNNSAPPVCGAQPGDHSLVPVTVSAGATVTDIDITDWYYIQGTYPPRPTPR